MNHVERIFVKAGSPPIIEIDPTCACAYIRFKSGSKVAKTKTVTAKQLPVVCTIDFDASNQVIGVEMINVLEFSISWIMKHLPTQAPRVNFSRARFIPASCAHDLVGA